MNTVLEYLDKKIIPAIALDSAEPCWISTVQNCLPARVFNRLQAALVARTSGFSSLGTVLQQLGFALVVLMFFILAAPQFANDKEGLAALVVAALGLRWLGTLLNGKEKYAPSAIDGIVLLYFAVNVVASFASHYLKESLFGLAKLFVYLIAYFLFAGCLQQRTRQRAVILLCSLVGGAFLVSVYGLYQYKIGVAPLATWEDPTIEDKATRVFSTLGNPNLLAGYLVPVIPLGFCLSMIAIFSSSGWKRWLSIPALATTAVILAATVLTGSRGGYLALIGEALVLLVVSFAWLWCTKPRTRIALLLAFLLIPIAAVLTVHFALPSFEHRFLSIFAGSEHSSNAYRLNVWRSSLMMFQDNWWIGIGTGNKTFELAYGLYMRSGFDALGTYCVPLEIAVETGIPGLLVSGWLLAALCARAHHRFWKSHDQVVRWLAIGSIAAITGMIFHGLFDTVFYRPQVQFIFWLTVSMLAALAPNYKTEAEIQ